MRERRRPELLWNPSPERVERAAITSVRPRARAARPTTPSSGAGRSTTSSASGRRSGPTTASAAPTTRSSPTARCPGAQLVSRAPRSTTPATSSPIAIPTRSRSVTPPSCASSPSAPGGSWPSQTARIRAGLVALGVGRGRPRRRLHAEHPRDGPRLLGGRVAGRDLVLGGARVRRPQRHRPLRPDRAEGPARRRRLPLRRHATSTAPRSSHAIAAEIPGLERTVRFGYLDGSGWEDGLPRPGGLASSSSRGCRSTTRSGSSTRRARPACRSRSSTATAACCSST